MTRNQVSQRVRIQRFSRRTSAGENNLSRINGISDSSTAPSGTAHHRGEVTHINTIAGYMLVNMVLVRVLKSTITDNVGGEQS